MTLEEAIQHLKESLSDPTHKWGCEECKEEHEQLLEWLEDYKQLKEATRWIPCSERLPETIEEGLGVLYSDCTLVKSGDWIGMAYYLTDSEKSWWEFADAQNKQKIDWVEITHWMPLPEPPQRKDDTHDYD